MTVSTHRAWETLYTTHKLESWGLPAFENLDPEEGTFSKLYQKASELPKKTPDGELIDFYMICADVFFIDQTFEIDQSTYIFARRIEVASGASIRLNRTKEPVALLIATQEVVTEQGQPNQLHIQVNNPESQYSTKFSARATDPVTIIEWEDDLNEREYGIQDLDEAYLYEGEPLRVYLRCIFQLATLLSSEQPDLCVQQYHWVAALAAGSVETRTICGEALALASLNARLLNNKGVVLVPDLDYSVYAESAEAFLLLLQRRQDKQDRMEQSRNNNANWLAAAKDVLEKNMSDAELNKNLLAKAKKTRDQVLEARATAARQIALQRTVLYAAERDFRAGVEKWKIDQFVKAIFEMFMGALKMFSAIPSMVVTGPVAGFPAILSIASTAAGLAAKGVGKTIGASGRASLAPSAGAGGGRFIDDARSYVKALRDDNNEKEAREILAQIDPTAALPPNQDPIDALLQELDDFEENLNGQAGDDIDYDNASQADLDKIKLTNKELAAKRKAANAEFEKGVKEFGAGAGDIMDAAMNLVAANAKAEKLKAMSQNALLASNQAVNVSMSQLELEGLDVVTGGAQVWDEFALAVDQLFERRPELEQIEGGSVYRKEMNKLILLGKTYAMTRLAVAKADGELAEMIMRERSANQSVRIYESRVAELGDQAMNDATIAQLAYGKILDAKRAVYLAMESYRRALLFHTLAEDTQIAPLPKFSSNIDEFYQAGAKIVGRRTASELFADEPRTIPLNPYTINKNDLPETLFSEGIINISIPSTHHWFNGMYRVRIDQVRIFALGLKATGNVVATISTSGTYEDKAKNGQVKRFTAHPIKLKFIYDAQDPSIIRLETKIAPRFENDFFKPTPFTNWTIQFTQQEGGELDFSTITGLKVEFMGVASNM